MNGGRLVAWVYFINALFIYLSKFRIDFYNLFARAGKLETVKSDQMNCMNIFVFCFFCMYLFYGRDKLDKCIANVHETFTWSTDLFCDKNVNICILACDEFTLWFWAAIVSQFHKWSLWFTQLTACSIDIFIYLNFYVSSTAFENRMQFHSDVGVFVLLNRHCYCRMGSSLHWILWYK